MTNDLARQSAAPSDLQAISKEMTSPTRTNLETVQQQAIQAIAAVWERSRDAVMARLAVLEIASLAFQHGTLGDDDRRQVVRDAHHLAGSLGTFGFAEGSRLASEIEHSFDAAAPLDGEQFGHLAALVGALRAELDLGSARPSVAARPDDEPIRRQGIDGNVGISDRTAVAATYTDLRTRVAPLPDVVLRDPTVTSRWGKEHLISREQAAQAPEPPVAGRSTTATIIERIALAVLKKDEVVSAPARTAPAPEEGDQGADQLRITATRLLAVDDDPLVLELLRVLLEPSGMHVTTLDDPLRFEDMLDEISPDLLVLDVDMPGLTGIDLCTLVRSNPRWSTVPVIFLTAHTDATTIKKIFTVGGDDYLAKPIVGPELLARIAIRADRDPLLPRMMMHLYQQRIRSELLATVAEQPPQRPGWRRLLAFGQHAVARAVRR